MDEVTDGLERISLDNGRGAPESGSPGGMDLQDLAGLPSILIITNVADSVFDDAQAKVSKGWGLWPHAYTGATIQATGLTP